MLIAGGFDMVIFLTGVGTRDLAQAIETRIPRETWTAGPARTKVVVRGPKPLVALREAKVRIDLHVPEPTLAPARERARREPAGRQFAGRRAGIWQVEPRPDRGTRGSGATVMRVPVYRWALPEDTGPLRRAIEEIADGQIGAVLFTSAQQVVHMLDVAAEMGREAELLARYLMGRTVVGSIGPTTSETLHERGLPVDLSRNTRKDGSSGCSGCRPLAASPWMLALQVQPPPSCSVSPFEQKASSDRTLGLVHRHPRSSKRSPGDGRSGAEILPAHLSMEAACSRCLAAIRPY